MNESGLSGSLFKTAPFPDDALKLSHFLGPGIDVGPAMTAKIFAQNGLPYIMDYKTS